MVSENTDLATIFETVELLDFYGAGAGTQTPNEILTKVLKDPAPTATSTTSPRAAFGAGLFLCCLFFQ